jgi:hypothetical protein
MNALFAVARTLSPCGWFGPISMASHPSRTKRPVSPLPPSVDFESKNKVSRRKGWKGATAKELAQ